VQRLRQVAALEPGQGGLELAAQLVEIGLGLLARCADDHLKDFTQLGDLGAQCLHFALMLAGFD
jgi:hypothetical protein